MKSELFYRYFGPPTPFKNRLLEDIGVDQFKKILPPEVSNPNFIG
jgi:hypothetical protein